MPDLQAVYKEDNEAFGPEGLNGADVPRVQSGSVGVGRVRACTSYRLRRLGWSVVSFIPQSTLSPSTPFKDSSIQVLLLYTCIDQSIVLSLEIPVLVMAMSDFSMTV